MNSFSKIASAGCLLLFSTLLVENVNAQNTTAPMNNPLLQRSTLQYQTPPFDKIKDEHFKPAFDYGLKVHDEEIEKINQRSIFATPLYAEFMNTKFSEHIMQAKMNRPGATHWMPT